MRGVVNGTGEYLFLALLVFLLSRFLPEKFKKLSLQIAISLFLMSCGGVLNLIAMIANNGKMPVKFFPGVGLEPSDNLHCILDETSQLPFLADIFPIFYGNEAYCVLSAGDLLLYLGYFGMLFATVFFFLKFFTKEEI